MSNPINGDVSATVFLANYRVAQYNGPPIYELSIASTGRIDPVATALYGANGVQGTGGIPGVTVTNAGTVIGGNSSGPTSAAALGAGGIGIDLPSLAAVLDNTGSITGGNGGNAGGTAGWGGGVGGVGAKLSGPLVAFTNMFGTIAGGNGGNSASGIGGAGGVGVLLEIGDSISDTGGNGSNASIKGGAGGTGEQRGGVGGSGLNASGSIILHGGIDGGAGGNGVYNATIGGAADGGNGGTAVYLSGGGQLTVDAVELIGGAGGIGGNAFAAGAGLSGTGGTGVYVESATLINSAIPVPGGFIEGGQGGDGHAGGAGAGVGGIGVNVGVGGTFVNQAVVWGGAGGDAVDTTGSTAASNGGVGGIGVYLHTEGQLTGRGVIVGGVGGDVNTPGGTAGRGGVGVLVSDATLSAASLLGSEITGGAGGNGGATSFGGTGGAGIELSNDLYSLNGSGIATQTTITGGAGGTGGEGDGAGGVGVDLVGARLSVAGQIVGGLSGNGLVQADSVKFAAGFYSHLTVEAGAAFKGAIGGFSYGDTVTVTTLAPSAVQSDFNTTTDTLSLPTADGGTLQFSGNFTGETFTFTADGGGTDITLEAACYRRGTHLATPAGDIRIEQLGVGDLVLTAAGEARAVRWLGYRTLDVTQHPEPKTVWPVRVAAGAFGVGLPVRDLYLSPGHNVVVGDSLVPIAALVNGATIRQIPCDTVEYWHVELDQHDIVLAEKLAAESYLDTGNRAAFSNGGEFVERHPSFAPVHWSDTCLPLVFDGAVVDAARSRLMERAHEVGFTITADDDLHIVADGTRIEAVTLSPARRAFVLPEGARVIELRSREFVPAEVLAGSRDVRRLGVCVGSLALDGDAVPLENVQQFEQGWHGLEQTADGVMQRWTTGTAVLPPKTRLVFVDLAGRGHYWQRALPRSVAVA